METEFAMRGLLSGADIGIIGGADGPTAVLVARSAFLWLLPLIALGLLTAAYLAMCRAARKKRHSVTELPAGYRRIYTVDMRQSRRLLLFLSLAQLLVALAMLSYLRKALLGNRAGSVSLSDAIFDVDRRLDRIYPPA